LFTRIIPAIVIPRKTSSENEPFGGGFGRQRKAVGAATAAARRHPAAV
jgi:hypothetical protein